MSQRGRKAFRRTTFSGIFGWGFPLTPFQHFSNLDTRGQCARLEVLHSGCGGVTTLPKARRKNESILHYPSISTSTDSMTPASLVLTRAKSMDELPLTTGSDQNGLKAIVVENRWLRIVVLPEAGAKIWQIVYKPLDVEILPV